MSDETEWVLVPREPSAGMWDSAENAMVESECAYNAGDPDARSDAHGFPTMRIWQAVVGYRAMLAAAPQPPAEAQPVANGVVQRHVVTKFSDGSTRVEDVLAAPPPADARGDVRYDRELIAQMLDAAEAPAFTKEEMDTQARLLREAAQAKPDARGVVDEGSRAAQHPGGGDLDEVVCLACGDHIMPMGQLCHACSHPVSEPPSAPVGVASAAEAVMAVPELQDMACIGSMSPAEHALGLLQQAFAQQPAAVGDSEREQVIARLREVHDALRETEHYGLGKACGRMADGLAAQQPAAMAGGFDRARFRESPCYLCGYDGAGYFQPVTHPCAALYHAAQQGGGTDE